ncbi:MAG: proton-conducting transporter membrane subunit [Acidocella sp.]|nr:proton-conducting transporter membrane subunit [Acidocella sp.]
MSFALAAICLPLFATVFLALAGSPLLGARINLGLSTAVFALTLGVVSHPGHGLVAADPLGAIFGVLTGFVSLTIGVSNIGFVRCEQAGFSHRQWRVYHALCQMVLGSTLLGLYADNIGLLWAATEGATLACIFGVGLPRTATALEAAWKYFILGGVGIALALFGTMLVYLAAQPALGPGLPALSLIALSAHAGRLDGSLLTLAFVFLLFGYGTKAALVPLHGWLPDAYAEGPAPLTTALSGLTLNVALIAILRFRHLLQANRLEGGAAMPPGPFLLVLGLASILLTAFSLSRRRDSRRFFGFSSIEHSGLAVFAFGVGGATAIFGGLLHMVIHTLIKSALFQALIRAASFRGGAGAGQFGFSHLRGMMAANKYLAWVLGACVFALTGLPPSGLFVSEFIIISQTIQREPLAALPLGLGLALCALAVIRTIGPMVIGPPPKPVTPTKAGVTAHLASLHLILAFGVAFAMPWFLVRALSAIAVALR